MGANSSGPDIKARSMGIIVEEWKDKRNSALGKTGGCKGDWAPDSRRILSYIIVCDYDTTYLQENPQRLE